MPFLLGTRQFIEALVWLWLQDYLPRGIDYWAYLLTIAGANADPEFFVRTDAVKGAASQKRARASGSYLHQYDPRQNS